MRDTIFVTAKQARIVANGNSPSLHIEMRAYKRIPPPRVFFVRRR